MRVSVNRADPGYDPKCHTANITIFLDGVVIPLVETADDQEGYIKYCPLDGEGKAIRHEVNGELQRLKLEKYGKVRIEVDPKQ